MATSGDGGRRVLLVEEQPDGRDMLRFALEHAGYRVDTAYDEETGLLTAAAHAPEVVIIDINPPTLNGWTFARLLRQVFGRRVRLIALTSRGDPEDRERSRFAGFDLHLVKPVAPVQVQRVIQRLLHT